ncbi:MAG: hypothetical protein KDE56_29610, partial [Anaerolineales bacterium]|nr:hypothetical protein [Anaerolineales bacterium]
CLFLTQRHLWHPKNDSNLWGLFGCLQNNRAKKQQASHVIPRSSEESFRFLEVKDSSLRRLRSE